MTNMSSQESHRALPQAEKPSSSSRPESSKKPNNALKRVLLGVAASAISLVGSPADNPVQREPIPISASTSPEEQEKESLLVGPASTDGAISLVVPSADNPSAHTEPIPAPVSLVDQLSEPTATVVPYSEDQLKENSLTDPASIERLKYQKEIEKKYGIELLTIKQAYEFLGITYNELDSNLIPLNAPVRWDSKQLKLFDAVFSYMPPTLYEPINGINLKLFQAELGSTNTSCLCDGQHFGSGVVGVNEQYDRWRAFNTTVHEATHRMDDLTGYSVQAGVRGIIGDRLRELHMEQSFILGNTKPDSFESETVFSLADTDIYKPQIGSSNAYNHRTFKEGVAQLSQMYIRGYEEFMSSLGPILDGSGKSVKEADPSISSAKNFPKTQTLYELYKKNVFGDMEYDKKLRESIAGRAEDVNLVDSMEQKYGIKIEAETDLYPGGFQESMLLEILGVFPTDFYSAFNGKKLTVNIKDGRWEGNEYSVSKSGNIVLHKDNFYASKSQTLITGRSRVTALSTFDSLANGLVIRRDEITGYETRDNIIGILGGEAVLNSPETLYPEFIKIRGPADPYAGEVYSIFYSGDLPNHKSVRSSSEIVGRLGVLYTRGWKYFNESLEPFIDPTKTSEIYSQMKKLYGGVEFMDGGVPARLLEPELNDGLIR